MIELPVPRFSRVGLPEPPAAELADLVLAALGEPPRDANALVTAFGWCLRHTLLDADRGGQDALLLPLRRGGFSVVVDPRVSARQYWMPAARRPSNAFRRSTVLFRVAHELGHAFFYTAGRPPRRRAAPTSEEERFCDLFAAALLIPDRTDANARKIATVARHHGGNLELAALWAAAVAPRAVVRITTADGTAVAFGAARRTRRAAETTAVGGRTVIRVAA